MQRRGARRGIAAALVALATIVVARSHAQSTTTATLAWVRAPGAETCINGPTLQTRVSARLGRDAFAAPSTLSIDGVVERTSKKWVARLWVRTSDGAPIGTRELENDAQSCDSLGEAVALAVALAIDPERALAAPTSASVSPVASSAAPPASATAPAKRKRAPPEPRLPAPSVVRVEEERPSALVASLATVTGVVPSTAFGGVVSFEPDFAARIRPVFAAILVPSQRTDDGSLGVGVTFASLGVCARMFADPDSPAHLCASLLGGVTHAVAYGLVADEPGDRPWLAASAGARLRLPLYGPVGVELGAEVFVPFVRRSFAATGDGAHRVLYQQPWAGVMSAFGLVFRFG